MMIVDCSAYGPGSGVRPARRDSETYTPGPWTVCPKNNPPSQEKPPWMDGVTIYSESTGKRIADTCWLNSSNDHNARLIAAAPDLLEALRDLIAAVEAEVNEKGGGGFILARLTDARDAVRKATEGASMKGIGP